MKKSPSPSKKPSDVVSIRKSSKSNGGGLLATLRRILQRRKARAADSASASASSLQRSQSPTTNATAQHASSTPGGHHADPSRRLSQMIGMLSAPKGASHEPTAGGTQELKGSAGADESGEEEEGGEDDGSDNEEAGEGNGGSKAKTKASKGKKGTMKSKKNRWVRQLLNQDAKKKDRLPAAARKKCHLKPHSHKEPRALLPPPLFSVTSPLNSYLTARILLFLEVRQPAAVCTHVNKAFEAHVRAFYELHCPHPRPQRYLTKKLFNFPPTGRTSEPETETSNGNDGVAKIPERILSFLGIAERVNASSCCQSLYRASNALALAIVGSQNVARFVESMTPERVEVRFSATSVLELEDMDADQAVNVVRFMDTNENECFASLSVLTLRRIRDFSSSFSSKSEALFVQLIQVLFTDSVSHKLQTLELSDMGFEDFHYRYLAKLLYGARFPALRCLNLSKNKFSSRFMRDWSRSFLNYRFQRLEELNIAASDHLAAVDVAMTDEDTQRFVACLENVPTLLRLCISHNFFSFEAVAMLGEQIKRGSLRNLVELECSAITADVNAMGSLFDAFHDSNGCPKLEKLDFSGNPVTNPKVSFKLSRLFAAQSCCWPRMKHMDLSNMNLGESGFQTLADAIREAPESTREISYLDVSGNSIQRAMHSFIRCLLSRAFSKLRFLSLADNGLEALEFELIAHALSQNCCPLLQTLDLSTNAARGEGIARFCAFLSSEMARKLYVLDLSQNEIPHRGLVLLTETLSKGNCLQLQQLNIARNLDLRSVVKYQDMIRSFACPSLVSLQFGYAQTFVEGQAFVKDVLSRMSVEELVRMASSPIALNIACTELGRVTNNRIPIHPIQCRRKQALFEQRLAAIQKCNSAKALRDQARCKRQCQLLRDRYDHLESEADRALRRRKKIRKSPHLMIHQEIQRLKQEKYHHNLCKALGNQ